MQLAKIISEAYLSPSKNQSPATNATPRSCIAAWNSFAQLVNLRMPDGICPRCYYEKARGVHFGK
jgi:hypothetical protein